MNVSAKNASLVFAVIGLIVLLLTSTTPIQQYAQFKYFLAFCMIFIMTFWMTGYVRHSFYYAAVITLVVMLALPYLCNARMAMEHFEARAKKKKKETFDNPSDDEEETGSSDDNEKDFQGFANKENFDSNDRKLLNIDIDVDSDEEIENARGIKSYNDPYIAQKETYRLIDTVKQLKDATTSLAPILKEGRGVMDAFKKLNIKL